MSSTEKTLLALGVGIAIGVGLGILFAPRKGSETREKLGNDFERCREKVNEIFDSFRASDDADNDKPVENNL